MASVLQSQIIVTLRPLLRLNGQSRSTAKVFHISRASLSCCCPDTVFAQFKADQMDMEPEGPTFAPTRRQIQLIEKTRKFAQRSIAPMALHYDLNQEYPYEVHRQAFVAGLNNHLIPRKYGGPGYTVTEAALILEEIGYGCSGIATPITTQNLSHAPLLMYGNEEQKREYLGRLTERFSVSAYCVTEPSAGSDVANVKTKAVQNKDGTWVLNGEKAWITGAGYANWYFVLARTNFDPAARPSNAFTGFIVERGWKGVSVGRKESNMGQRASDTRSVVFEDVIVPNENVVGTIGGGFRVAMGAFDMTRPLIAAGATGLARRAIDVVVQYLIDHGQEEDPLKMDAIGQMAMDMELARLGYLRAASQIDRGQKNTYWASLAKCFAGEISVRVTQKAVELLGFQGLNMECPAEKLLRDAKVFEIYAGSSQIQRLILARNTLAKYK